MDYVKMLHEALSAARSKGGEPEPKVGRMGENDDCHLDGCFSLQRAAALFLDRVREAEAAEAGDNTGPVPYRGEVG